MFVSEMRFQAARIFGLSYLIGLNSALAAYFLLLRPLKLYVKIPLTLVAFSLAKNFAIGHSIDRIYYPLQPIYSELRQTDNSFTPKPTAEREDLSVPDKLKA